MFIAQAWFYFLHVIGLLLPEWCAHGLRLLYCVTCSKAHVLGHCYIIEWWIAKYFNGLMYWCFVFLWSLFRQAVALLLQSHRKLCAFLVDEGVVKKKQIFSASQQYKHRPSLVLATHRDAYLWLCLCWFVRWQI